MNRIAFSCRQFAATMASVCVALALSTAVLAGEPPEGEGQHHGGMMGGGMMGGGMDGGMEGGHDMMPPFLHDLDLTDQQKDEVFKIVYASIPAMRDNGKAIRQAKDELRDQAMFGHFDSKAAQPLADTLGKSIAAMAMQRAETDAKIMALLTPEQQQKVRDAMKEHADQRGKGFFHRRQESGQQQSGKPKGSEA